MKKTYKDKFGFKKRKETENKISKRRAKNKVAALSRKINNKRKK